jgi:hypothetical protein
MEARKKSSEGESVSLLFSPRVCLKEVMITASLEETEGL